MMKLTIPALILLGSASVACGDDTANNDMSNNTAGSPGAGGEAGGASGGSSSGGKASTDGGSTAKGGSGQGGMDQGGAGGQGGSASGGEGAEGGAPQGGEGGESGGGEGGEMSGGSGGSAAGPDAEVEVTMESTGVSQEWADFAATATFTEEDGMVTLSIVATAGCPDGEHAWHIHQNGSCGSQGEDAGGHWQVDGNLQAGERGDALTCADGAGMTEVMVANPEPPEVGWTLMDGDDYNLRDHAIVIHEGGVANPGGRMACGVVPAAD